MEILDQVFAALENPPLSLGLEKESGMFGHNSEDFSEIRRVFTGQEAPRISETFSSDHKPIQIFQSFDPIVIIHHIPVPDDGDLEVFFKFVDSSPISCSSECLFVSTAMDGDEIGAGILETEREGDEFVVVVPAEACLDRDGDTDRLAHFFDDTECCVGVDHETRSMSGTHDFFGGTSHIDVNPSSSGLLDMDGCFAEHLRIFPKYLDDERFLAHIMSECGFSELFGVDESVRTEKFRETDGFRSDFFYDLAIRRIRVAVHGRESADGSLRNKIFPKLFRHSGV